MTLSARGGPADVPRDEDDLEERLSRPTAALTAVLASVPGDLLVLGAGGKMGPSLARMARRADPSRRVVAVSRWSNRHAADALEAHGVETMGADLLSPRELAALAECRDRLARRVSVMIFPEGTRTRTDELLPFKNGAFRLAIEARVPILPIAIAGTRDCMAKGSFAWRHAHAKARVLAPISTDGLTLADAAALRDRTRATIDAARRALQRELGAEPA